jgi:hypothetical protein
MREEISLQSFHMKESNQLGELSIDGRILLKVFLNIQERRVWAESLWMRIWTQHIFL